MEALVVIVWLLCGFGAMAVANQRGGSGCAGLALGFILGPIGLAIAFGVWEGKQCPKCAQTIPQAAVVCPKCQQQLSAAVTHKQCPFCAEEILAEAVKCKHCGEFLKVEPTEPVIETQAVPAEVESDSGSSAAFNAVIAIIALAVIAYVAMYIQNQRR